MTKRYGLILCEWCDTPLTYVKATANRTTPGMDLKEGEFKSVGHCPKCNGILWSKPYTEMKESDENEDHLRGVGN